MVAAVVSLIIPGCGQLCQGRVGTGVLLFVVGTIVWLATFGLGGWIVNAAAAVEAAVWKPGPAGTFIAYKPIRNRLYLISRVVGVGGGLLAMGAVLYSQGKEQPQPALGVIALVGFAMTFAGIGLGLYSRRLPIDGD